MDAYQYYAFVYTCCKPWWPNPCLARLPFRWAARVWSCFISADLAQLHRVCTACPVRMINWSDTCVVLPAWLGVSWVNNSTLCMCTEPVLSPMGESGCWAQRGLWEDIIAHPAIPVGCSSLHLCQRDLNIICYSEHLFTCPSAGVVLYLLELFLN